MDDADELGSFVDHRPEGICVELSGGVVGHDFDDGAMVLGCLQIGDVVGGVLGLSGQDPIAGTERNRMERQVPGHGGVFDQRDLVAARTDETCDRVADALEPLARGAGGGVPADL